MSNQIVSDRLQPVALTERIPALDMVRGFALFGVLVAYSLWNLGGPPENTYAPVDRVLDSLLAILIDAKFYTIFAFLFGFGFSIQLLRAGNRGVSIVPVYSRRLLALLLIGLVHALLLRNGDILVPYAVMGFFLLLFRNASNKTLALVGIIGFLFQYLSEGIWELTGLPLPQRPEMESSSYLAENLAWVRYWYSTAIIYWPGSLPMFLFGLYVGRLRFFENFVTRQAQLRPALLCGLCIGALALVCRILLVANVPDAFSSYGWRSLSRLLWSIHAWGLAMFYVSSLLLLLRRDTWKRRLAPLGAVGRMALSNYLLQALIIVPVCIGLNLFGRVTPRVGLLMALLVWSAQVWASVVWLKHFQFGPAEWLWRSLTYGFFQPMRLSQQTNGSAERLSGGATPAIAGTENTEK